MSLRSGIGYIPAEYGRAAVGAMLFGFGAYVFLFLFPLGISYRYASEFYSDAYHPGSGRMPEPKMQVDIGPRNADFFDFLLRLPLIGVIGVTAFAFLTDSVAPTLQLDQMAYSYLLPGMALAALLILFKPLVTMLRRPIVDAPRVHPIKKAAFVLLALPMLSLILYFSVAYHAVPWVWQKVKPAEEASLRYVVSENGLNDLVDGCLGLRFQETEDRAFTLCKLDAEITNDLLPGDIIEATGSLSQFGHSLSTLSVVSRVPRAPVVVQPPQVALLDEDGNPVLDEDGNPVMVDAEVADDAEVTETSDEAETTEADNTAASDS
jgi:hypothetical protein